MLTPTCVIECLPRLWLLQVARWCAPAGVVGEAKVRLREAGMDVSVCLQDREWVIKVGSSLGAAVAAALFVRALQRRFGSDGSGGRPVLQMRERVGISAQVNLRGELLPVGGLRPKLEAARQAGCSMVVLSSANEREVKALCRGEEVDDGDGVADDGLQSWIREHVKLADDMVDLLCLTLEGEVANDSY